MKFADGDEAEEYLRALVGRHPAVTTRAELVRVAKIAARSTGQWSIIAAVNTAAGVIADSDR